MIHYTIMPLELIFQPDMNEYNKQKEIVYEGVPLIVEMNEDRSYTVIKVNSSNPAHFLDPRFAPGNQIDKT